MKKPKISIICALAENRAIGRNNQLLWHISEDLRHFKTLTQGHVIIMGQKTYESIGKPLPNRVTLVLSNDETFAPEGVEVVRSLEEALDRAGELEKEEMFICGGGMVYRQTIDLADKLYLTVVKTSCEADTFFPEYDRFTKIVSTREGSEGKYCYTFIELEKE